MADTAAHRFMQAANPRGRENGVNLVHVAHPQHTLTFDWLSAHFLDHTHNQTIPSRPGSQPAKKRKLKEAEGEKRKSTDWKS